MHVYIILNGCESRLLKMRSTRITYIIRELPRNPHKQLKYMQIKRSVFKRVEDLK